MKKKISVLINHKAIIISLNLLLTLGYQAKAQNASYNKNDIPIGGVNNSAFGINSLPSTGGSNNTAIGYSALFSNANAPNNTAVGAYALYSNTSGTRNIAIGVYPLYSNNSGLNNIAIGASALYFNISGHFNCAIGDNALMSNTGGMFNTAVGNGSLNNSLSLFNTGIGALSLTSNTTGSYNTALGYVADVASGTLTNATAIGFGAIVNNSNSIQLGNSSVTSVYAGVGINSTLITGGLQVTGGTIVPGYVLTCGLGGMATWQPPSGGSIKTWLTNGNLGTIDGTNYIGTNDNVPFNIRVNNITAGRLDANLSTAFYGTQAGINNTTGRCNTAIGNHAMYYNTVGEFNTVVGHGALVNNMSGTGNTAFGSAALWFNMSGNYNTGIGYDADVLNSHYTNATALGAFAVVDDDNKVRIGDVNVTVIEGQPQFYTGSDGRFKTNINEEDVKGLEFIKLLRPVSYNFDTRKFEEFLTKKMPDSIRKKRLDRDFTASTNIRHSGFIAQEVEKAANEVAYNFDAINKPANEDDNYSLAYGQFVVPLVKSVQELSKQNEGLKKEIDELRSMIKNISNENKEGRIKITGSNTDAQLFQNAPNPFRKSTIIRYSIPADARNAILSITSSDGIKVSEFNLINNKGQAIEIAGGSLSAGTYIYSLFVDNKLIDSKKMILTR